MSVVRSGGMCSGLRTWNKEDFVAGKKGVYADLDDRGGGSSFSVASKGRS